MLTAQHLEEHRAALIGHCYRMLGSAAEADDAVQETLVRAWRSMDRFEGRASLRTWLHRIATRVCLDAIGDRSRRARPMDLRPAGTVDDPLTPRPPGEWIDPIPDAAAIPSDADPAERAALRQSIRLAFVAALQHLPPRQRAVLLLADVLGWSAAEIAESIETTVAAVNSALQRARATLASRDLSAAGRAEPDPVLLERYVDAFERFDVDALTALLHEDATFSMPPFDLWLRGRTAVRAWLLGRGAGCRGSRLVPTAACGSPAFGHYKPSGSGYHAWALLVLETSGDHVTGWNSFLDVEAQFPRFGLPLDLPATPSLDAVPQAT
jgi:RNA polymerase sigma-70 factor (ECF subfamily)